MPLDTTSFVMYITTDAHSYDNSGILRLDGSTNSNSSLTSFEPAGDSVPPLITLPTPEPPLLVPVILSLAWMLGVAARRTRRDGRGDSRA